jgi:hypothetical protein
LRDEFVTNPNSELAAINVWNRLNIAARTEPGTYRPGKTLASNR